MCVCMGEGEGGKCIKEYKYIMGKTTPMECHTVIKSVDTVFHSSPYYRAGRSSQYFLYRGIYS